jgi:alpha-mannosidase
MYSYLFKYEIDLPEDARSITLPKNEKIKVLAITVADDKNSKCTPLQLLYDDFKNEKLVQLRTAASN